MPSPPVATVPHFVDAVHAARNAGRVQRSFTAAELPRLLEAGGGEVSQLSVDLSFAQLEGHAAIDGQLTGSVMLTCQRCMRPVAVAVDERFQVVVVSDENDAPEEFGGYEPIVADAARFDLKWLAEEQTLLALPLVPMHPPGSCVAKQVSAEVAGAEAVRQQPFGNLRDLLQKR